MSYTENMEDFIRSADNGIQNWQPGNSFFSKVYLLMTAALILTSVSSYIVSKFFEDLINSNPFIVFGFLLLELHTRHHAQREVRDDVQEGGGPGADADRRVVTCIAIPQMACRKVQDA